MVDRWKMNIGTARQEQDNGGVVSATLRFNYVRAHEPIRSAFWP